MVGNVLEYIKSLSDMTGQPRAVCLRLLAVATMQSGHNSISDHADTFGVYTAARIAREHGLYKLPKPRSDWYVERRRVTIEAAILIRSLVRQHNMSVAYASSIVARYTVRVVDGAVYYWHPVFQALETSVPLECRECSSGPFDCACAADGDRLLPHCGDCDCAPCNCPSCDCCGERSGEDFCGGCSCCSSCCSCRECILDETISYSNHCGQRRWGEPTADWPRYMGLEVEISRFESVDTYAARELSRWLTSIGGGIKTDGSLDDIGREIVLPPARGDYFPRHVGMLCRLLRPLHPVITTAAGLHVHVDAEDLEQYHKESIDALWGELEDEALDLCPASRRGNEYCRSVLRHSINDTRYRTLNHTDYGTLEFRLWGGTTRYDRMVGAAAISLAVVETRGGKPAPKVTLETIVPAKWREWIVKRKLEIGCGQRVLDL